MRCRAERRRFATLILAALASSPAAPVAAQAGGDEPAAWRRTLERIATGVVAIRVDSARSFDTEWNDSTEATGFVVDAERGLILTNRHVVGPGPVRAEALFLNQEEVELAPLYRDPVHDFGFFRYDPAQLRHMRPAAIGLAPAAAEVGREIRVVGNDGGEQLSILSGTIARTRRPAPDYGRGSYNDFNTFYLQAASGTSGGSSGSPVIDIEGRAVALNAGASGAAASSYFLPLERVTRALDALRAGHAVTRGTLGVTFTHRPFDELRRLGLRESTEAATRRHFPNQTGMLVVSQVLPGGVADPVLRVGDILVGADGRRISEFVPLEELLDQRVGERVVIAVERNGEPLEASLPVADLHGITPDEYLEFGEAVVHRLSYQQARHLNRAAEGIYVASPGYVLGTASIARASLITAVDGRPVPDLDALEAALDGLADGERATLRYISFDDTSSSQLAVIRMDRRWFPARRCRRDDRQGQWRCRALGPGPAPARPEAAAVNFAWHRDTRLRRIIPSLVTVEFDMPYTISGVNERHYYGTGLVVDAQRGLVVVDRNTVPEAMGDVRITFAGSLEVPGAVVYVHPTHNLAVVSYDPGLLGETATRSAKLDVNLPQPGQEVLVAGLREDHRLVYRDSRIAALEPVDFPLSRTMRFRDTNLETLDLVSAPADFDGVILGRDGAVLALWSSFAHQGSADVEQTNRGVPASLVEEVLALARGARELRSLEVEWQQVPLATARQLGLPADWIRRLQEHDPQRPQALGVRRLVAGSPAARILQPGDLLLSVDGRLVTRFRELELALREPQVGLLVLRAGEPLALPVETVPLGGSGVRRALVWAGALLQAPYRELAAQRGIDPVGVYVAYYAYGSPAARHGLLAGRRIVEVDGVATPDLDAFVAAAARARANGKASLRLTTVTWNEVTEVLTVKPDETYWPAYEIAWREDGWRISPLPRAPAVSEGPAAALRTSRASR